MYNDNMYYINIKKLCQQKYEHFKLEYDNKADEPLIQAHPFYSISSNPMK